MADPQETPAQASIATCSIPKAVAAAVAQLVDCELAKPGAWQVPGHYLQDLCWVTLRLLQDLCWETLQPLMQNRNDAAEGVACVACVASVRNTLHSVYRRGRERLVGMLPNPLATDPSFVGLEEGVAGLLSMALPAAQETPLGTETPAEAARAAAIASVLVLSVQEVGMG